MQSQSSLLSLLNCSAFIDWRINFIKSRSKKHLYNKHSKPNFRFVSLFQNVATTY